MDIKDLQKNWNQFGKMDPLWSILTSPDKKGNKWDIHEFLATGEGEIYAAMEYLKSLGSNVPRRKALDFGCGVGRLTQALARYFDEVYGVDIAPSMIELAKKYNRHGDRCRYYLNNTDDLKLFSNNSFDLIYTVITLQHMKPQYSKNYIKEFLRMLAPHGVLIFQLPSEPIIINETGTINLKELILRLVPRRLLRATYRRMKYDNQPKMEIYWIKRQEVVEFLERNGAQIIDIKQARRPFLHFVNWRYCVTKK